MRIHSCLSRDHNDVEVYFPIFAQTESESRRQRSVWGDTLEAFGGILKRGRLSAAVVFLALLFGAISEYIVWRERFVLGNKAK